MMKKKLFLTVIGLGLMYLGTTQSLSPSVISSSGTVSQGQDIQLEWTLGEPAVQSLRTTRGLITEGFHQPMLKVEALQLPEHSQGTAISPAIRESLEITIAPNPVQSLLSITIRSDLDQQGTIYLSDLTGRQLQRLDTSLYDQTMEWDFSQYPSGLYLLSFYTKDGTRLKTFKVTKAN